MKKVLTTQRSDNPHWVGDGFPVRSAFSYNDLGQDISPFLLLDYAGPINFPATDRKLGVGEHPHRGFETVTIVYSGEVEHKDSSGGGGTISPGDVQWMTAGSGLVHEEFHGKNFAKEGGAFEMVQLWVNLPKKYKMTGPRYQGIKDETIPAIDLENGAGKIRIIAGEYNGHSGPAKTFSAINLWDIRLKKGHRTVLKVPQGHTSSLFVLEGNLEMEDGKKIETAEVAVLERDGEFISILAQEDSKLLFMGGEPLNEPIVGYGPFVMNTQNEIHQAFVDFNSGKMGKLERIEGAE